MPSVINVENISKSYTLNHHEIKTSRSLREDLTNNLTRFIGSINQSNPKKKIDTFWALQDVSFSIEAGERVGIIGRNGAGKSTLLKILSRITKPTTGRITLRGKLGSLLEVGTGFHPELTGRENIFLNGAILGMSRNEVRKQFSEIVEFAEIERFLDTPVKRYSSGMYVRLAFAIAAHFEPDLLILDEVLAVGDQKFQKKCFERIQHIANKNGKAVVLVSHSMASVKSLCNKAILIESGQISAIGSPVDVIRKYEGRLESSGYIDLASFRNRTIVDESTQIKWVHINPNKPASNAKYLQIGDELQLNFGIEFAPAHANQDIKIAIKITNSTGLVFVNMTNTDSNFRIKDVKQFETFSIRLQNIRFSPGSYLISLWLGTGDSKTLDHIHDCLEFNMIDHEGSINQSGLLSLTPEWNRS